MKKLILAVFSMCFISAASFAQTAAAKVDKAKTPAQAQKMQAAKVAKSDKTAKPVVADPAAPAAATTAPVKKDGTPDKRFKANKKTKTAPAKKDGTPDMRYKENKAKPKS